MDFRELEKRCPKLFKASWDMFYDGGGSEQFADILSKGMEGCLPLVTDEELLAAEQEIAALDDDKYHMAVFGEYWDQLLVCSDHLSWVLTLLFGEEYDKDDFIATLRRDRAAIPGDYVLGTNTNGG